MAPATPEVRIGDPDRVVEIVAADFDAASRRALARHQVFTIAIPGGSVATTCFARLASLTIDWERVEFFWVDERAVPPDSPDSNYAAARSLWLERARVPATRIHRIRGEADSLSQAAREYSDELARVAGTPPRLDYVLLGVGPDGHVASLFPGRVETADGRWVLAVEDAPKPLARRLTLSLPALTHAERVVIVATGEEKSAAVRAALVEGSSLPVARVARDARSCMFVLDRSAARLL